MSKLRSEDVRNVALIGHNDSGKTSLAEALLFKAKATNRLGQVGEGTTVFDFDPEEKERKVSIDLGVAFAFHDGKQIHLLDAPGYSEFCAEAVSALHAAETALLCVHAASGVTVNTRKMWKLARERGVALAVCVNKLDYPNSDFPKVVESVRETFGRECVPVMLPVGSGDGLRGIASLLGPGDSVPGEFAALAEEAREKLMEIDDALLEKYLEGSEVAPEEVARALPAAIRGGRVVPILCASVEKDAGVGECLDFIARFLPSPVDAGPRSGENPEKKEPVQRAPSPDQPFSAQVFKAVADPFVGRLCYLRVYSGRIRGDQNLFNARTGKESRIGKFFRPFGREERACPEAFAGEIVCVTKVDDLLIGDTVCDPRNPIRYPAPAFPTPMVGLAVEPESQKDLARLSESLAKMAESDPSLRV